MKKFKNILITRTDRIGDLVLATPVIAQLKEAYPDAKISFLTTPYTADLVKGNPNVDEVIIYDKKGKEKGLWGGILFFAFKLALKRFDSVFVLHPTNRMHIVTFLAGIPQRFGWDRKNGKLLNHRLKHTKHLGEKHESEYNLDLLKLANVGTSKATLDLPYNYIANKLGDKPLAKFGIDLNDKYLVFALGASCPSKQWPAELFAEVANRLIDANPEIRIVILGSKNEDKLAQVFIKNFKYDCINLCGKLSLSELIYFFKHIYAFIGNDSGLSHIAAAFNKPLISLFGRSDPGLSPRRWQPLGDKSFYLHKDVNCVKCLAHNCEHEFKCIRSILVDEVVDLAEKNFH